LKYAQPIPYELVERVVAVLSDRRQDGARRSGEARQGTEGGKG
jgi:hypothetical protein